MELIDTDKFDEDRVYFRARLILVDGKRTAGYHAVLTSVQVKDAPTVDAIKIAKS